MVVGGRGGRRREKGDGGGHGGLAAEPQREVDNRGGDKGEGNRKTEWKGQGGPSCRLVERKVPNYIRKTGAPSSGGKGFIREKFL